MGAHQPRWYPDTLWWLVTWKCNLRCTHCYLEPWARRDSDLDTGEAMAALSSAADAGLLRLFLTGGEPMLRGDLPHLIDVAAGLGMCVVGVETNATPLNTAVLQALAHHRPVFYLSFDGAGAHDGIRGQKGIERRLLASIRRLLGEGHRVVLNTSLGPANAEAVLHSFDLVAGLGVHGWRVSPPATLGAWAKQEEISVEDEVHLYKALLDGWKEQGRPFGLWLGSVLTQRRNGEASVAAPRFTCQHFHNTVVMLPDGRCVPCCRFLDQQEVLTGMTSTLKVPLRDQLRSSALARFKNTAFRSLLANPHNEACLNCDLVDLCQLGCRATARVAHGSMEVRDSRHCGMMKGYYRRWFEVHDTCPNSPQQKTAGPQEAP